MGQVRTFLNEILSVEMKDDEEEEAKEDLWGREEDLEEGRETEAVTAAAIAGMPRDHWAKEKDEEMK